MTFSESAEIEEPTAHIAAVCSNCHTEGPGAETANSAVAAAELRGWRVIMVPQPPDSDPNINWKGCGVALCARCQLEF